MRYLVAGLMLSVGTIGVADDQADSGATASEKIASDSISSDQSKAQLSQATLQGTRNVHVSGSVMLAGQPSKEALEELSGRGFKTVVSLRHSAEERFDEASLCEQLGMRFVRLPISSPNDMDRKLIQTACTLLKSATPESGVILHCASANRVGAVWLAHRVQEGKIAIEKARQEAAQVGLKTKELEDKAIEYLNQ